ncbi:hypothetical protein [Methanohalophilus profundi]|nr:hypothetical protein [Methanohalophilus profundi]
MTTTDTILEKLHENANPTAVDGMKSMVSHHLKSGEFQYRFCVALQRML